MSDYPRVRSLLAELAQVDISEVQQPIAELVANRRDLLLDPLRYVGSQMKYEGDGVTDEDVDDEGYNHLVYDDLSITWWTQNNFPAIEDENLYNEGSAEYWEAIERHWGSHVSAETKELLSREWHISPLVERYDTGATARQISDIFGGYYFGDNFKSYEPAITAYEAGIFGDIEESYVGTLEGALGFHPVIREFLVATTELKRAGKTIKDNWKLGR